MEISVEPSKTYAVTTSGNCTVTDADGLELCTASSGSQAFFVATTPTVTVSDDGAKVSRATFNYALAALGLLGGGADKLPAGYTRLEFLESTGTQWVTTGVVPTSRAGFRVRLSGPLSGTSWGYLMGTQNVSGGTRFYLAHASAFVAGFGADVYSSVKKIENEWVEENYKGSGKFKIGDTSINLQPLNFEPLYEFLLYRMAYRGNTPSDPTKPIRLFEFELSEGEGTVCKMVPALDPSGAPCMFDLLNKAAAKNKGTGQFIAGFTLAQARKLGKLPAGTKLTVSLPVGYDSDEGVVTSLAQAEANGCVLTIQTYESASAVSTFALRRVWVRKTQDENGSYVAADGSRWHVDWCVDIIGADPESLGYERYRSVDAATEYWGLVPYEYPEALSTDE